MKKAGLLLSILLIILFSCENKPKTTQTITCPVCNGTCKAYNRCYDCLGSGKLPCTNCNESGKTGIYICQECNGYGSFKCWRCKATGEYYGACARCSGHGKIRVE